MLVLSESFEDKISRTPQACSTGLLVEALFV
jgi:hypothetical protein